MTLSIGLTLALVSGIVVNWAYSNEHDAAAQMPPFSPRRPLRFVSLLLHDRRWVRAFATETAGWLVYVAALRLAPLSLVQAVCASGIAVLAIVSVRGDVARLPPHERLAALIAVAGLLLLALSLVDSQEQDNAPAWLPVAAWLASSTLLALAVSRLGRGFTRGPALGLSAGLLFAGGDISAKVIVYGGAWLAAVASLVVCYALGTSILQGSFQHGDALTGAGIATLATNAVPIAAGFVIFGEELPGGGRGVVQLAAFASLVVSAALLTRRRPSDVPSAAEAGNAGA